jgi:hypothetical protein
MDQKWEQIEQAVDELHDLNCRMLELNRLLRVTALDFRDGHERLGRLRGGLLSQAQSYEEAFMRSYVDQFLEAGRRLVGEFEAAGLYDPTPLTLVARQDARAGRG